MLQALLALEVALGAPKFADLVDPSPADGAPGAGMIMPGLDVGVEVTVRCVDAAAGFCAGVVGLCADVVAAVCPDTFAGADSTVLVACGAVNRATGLVGSFEDVQPATKHVPAARAAMAVSRRSGASVTSASPEARGPCPMRDVAASALPRRR